MKKSTLDKKLWRIFSEYIRLRDSNAQGYAPCISCGKIHHYKEMHAGHYITRAYRAIKFNEDNVHAQCVRCNAFLEGNSADYRKNLIKKIGIQKVEWLEAIKSQPTKMSTGDYELLINHYKQKIKGMRNG